MSSIQWTLIAGFLYVQIAVVLLLILPIASPKRWATIFRSKFLQGLRQQAGFYFVGLIGILVLVLIDAIREMRKHTHHTDNDERRQMQQDIRLFRAQRNFYISEFTLFLSLVIRRLISLILSQASLLAQSEASLKQAESASIVARTLLEKDNENENSGEDNNKNEEVEMLQEAVKKLEEQLALELKDKQAIISQSENLTKEYDRLLAEYGKIEDAAGDKKSD